MIINNQISTSKISNTIYALAIIMKSSLMFIMGALSSWLIGTLHDTSLIIIGIVWMICEIISDFIVTPTVESAKRVAIELAQNTK